MSFRVPTILSPQRPVIQLYDYIFCSYSYLRSETSAPKRTVMAKDGISSAENALADIERQDSVPMAKATNNAKSAAEAEHKMTLLQGIRTYPKAIAWSVLISTCIAMEGYDISLVNNFYAFPQFTRKYGELTSDGSYQVPAAVRQACGSSLFPSPQPLFFLLGLSMASLTHV